MAAVHSIQVALFGNVARSIASGMPGRAQKVAEAEGIRFVKGPHFKRDVFVWIPGRAPTLALTHAPDILQVQKHGIRAYYYTSMAGSDDVIRQTKLFIRDAGFYAEVFKRPRDARDVDTALTIDMLRGAYMSLYDVALLVSGDGDYLPVIREVQRMGKAVYMMRRPPRSESVYCCSGRCSRPSNFKLAATV